MKHEWKMKAKNVDKVTEKAIQGMKDADEDGRKIFYVYSGMITKLGRWYTRRNNE